MMGKPVGLDDYIGWLTDNFDPSISWKDLEWIRDFWDGSMVIKGILDAEDAKDAVRFGADGIVVSNHEGGRQLARYTINSSSFTLCRRCRQR